MKTPGILLRFLVTAALLCANVNAAQAEQAQVPKTPEGIAAVAEANNAFACDLYGKIRQAEGNIFFSPLSVSSALAMAYAGAKGDTATQMGAVLRFPFPQETLHPAYGAFLKRLNAVRGKGDVQLGVANSLWPRKGCGLLAGYADLLRDTYGVSVTPVEYLLEGGETARQEINAWVEEKTGGTIKNLIPPGAFTPLTRLTLVNAAYFKGDWQTTFDKDQTQDGPFFRKEGASIQAPLMRRRANFLYGQHTSLQTIELPYAGNEFSMLILLPVEKTPGALDALENTLSAERIALWRKRMSMREADLIMPKFSITWGTEELNGPLRALGMEDAFGDAADFSGMTGGGELFIHLLLHKAFVDVDEEGTEAAAATSMLMATKAGPPSRPVKFHANRPFLFLIQDNASGAILFMGRVNDPTAQGE